jgi:hypothetical protein
LLHEIHYRATRSPAGAASLVLDQEQGGASKRWIPARESASMVARCVASCRGLDPRLAQALASACRRQTLTHHHRRNSPCTASPHF